MGLNIGFDRSFYSSLLQKLEPGCKYKINKQIAQPIAQIFEVKYFTHKKFRVRKTI